MIFLSIGGIVGIYLHKSLRLYFFDLCHADQTKRKKIYTRQKARILPNGDYYIKHFATHTQFKSVQILAFQQFSNLILTTYKYYGPQSRLKK